MTIRSKLSNPIEVAEMRHVSWPLAVVILAVGVVLGVLASHMTVITGSFEASDAPERVVREFPVRPNLIELEKRTIVANQQAAVAAEAARYEGLSDYYGVKNRRATDAETARYEGLGEYYGVGAHSLAWPPRPTTFQPIENGVNCGPMSVCPQMAKPFHQPVENMARHFQGNALAAYHNGEWGRSDPVIEANANEDIGLMEFFAPEK